MAYKVEQSQLNLMARYSTERSGLELFREFEKVPAFSGVEF